MVNGSNGNITNNNNNNNNSTMTSTSTTSTLTSTNTSSSSTQTGIASCLNNSTTPLLSPSQIVSSSLPPLHPPNTLPIIPSSSSSSSSYPPPPTSITSSTSVSSSSLATTSPSPPELRRRERIKSFSWTVGESGTNARVSELSMTSSKSKSLKNEFTILYDILKTPEINTSHHIHKALPTTTNLHVPKYKTLLIQHPTSPNRQLLTNLLMRRGHNVTTLPIDINMIKQVHTQDPFTLFIYNQSPHIDQPVHIDALSSFPLTSLPSSNNNNSNSNTSNSPNSPSSYHHQYHHHHIQHVQQQHHQQQIEYIPNNDSIEFCKSLRCVVGNHCVIIVIAESNNPLEYASLIDVCNDYIPQPLSPVLLDVRLTCAERMISDQRSLLKSEELTESAKRMVSCVEFMQDGIEIWDPNGHIKYLNHSVAATSGYSRWELLGKEFSFLIDNQELIPQMWATITGGKNWNGFIRTKCHVTNQVIYFETNISPVYDSFEKLIYYNCIKRDVTQKRIDEESRTIEQEKTLEKSRLRLSMMSHDIRTPMSGIIGMTDLLSETDLHPQQRHYLDIIKVSSNSLLTIINDLLDISKIEAGKFEVDNIEFDFRDAVEEVCELMGERAQAKGLDLICSVHPLVPQKLIGDASRLKQILTNLLGNSVKFTDIGDIIIACTLQHIDQDDVDIRIEVKDTGIGIKKEALPLLFKAFTSAWQAEGGNITRQYAGSGLGLAICKELAQLAFNGEIGVESQYGVGSTFWTHLHFKPVQSTIQSTIARIQDININSSSPSKILGLANGCSSSSSTILEAQPTLLATPPAAAAGPVEPVLEYTSPTMFPLSPLPPSSLTIAQQIDMENLTVSSFNNPPNFGGIRVLLIEKKQSQRNILRQQFEAWNIQLETTTDDVSAMQMWNQKIKEDNPYSVIIMDSLTIGEGSLTLSQNITKKSHGKANPVRFLLLLPLKMRSAVLESEARKCGIGEIVTKPLRMSKLLDSLVTILGFKKNKPTVRIKPESLLESPHDLMEIRVLVVDDNGVNRQVALRMMQSAGCNADLASSGMEALDKMETTHYDIIFLDIMMPQMDGFQVTKEIREREVQKGVTRMIPIVAMTANAFKEDEAQCLKCGMNDYIPKPMKISQVRLMINKWKHYIFNQNLSNQQ
ncbi:histidine kinase [Cavenderia fasciculata]|uniref:Histidine kinase n=1 Tax=Cavenderia fasciculata TaxID=261658 RepID=F4PLD0_CACFS|nr:histidine kinase [Cavenderia fasciculata]EGG23352.1 histidine kinase [Cavenderia fasciculata]|eukprot:XP_004361203.1 histidine kinase [Cavenderia fasciculata]